jgi:CO dehydrogenase maturation factor
VSGPDAAVAADGPAGIRVVVVGKGGVGKTTLTALLARLLARDGARVVAVDADPQCNLGATLGLELEALAGVVPVADAADYIEEKTGARPGEGAGGMLRLNPDTDDLVDRLATAGPDDVRLLVMGGLRRAGGGCLCPENALLAAAVAGMHRRRGDVVVMDTHAGVEHFGRSLARGFDRVVVVTDPTHNAVQVGAQTARLAADLGITDAHLVVNRSRSDADPDRALALAQRFGAPGFRSVHVVPYDERVLDTEPAVTALLDGSAVTDAARALAKELRR